MNISELIEYLNEIRCDNGDIPVYVYVHSLDTDRDIFSLYVV